MVLEQSFVIIDDVKEYPDRLECVFMGHNYAYVKFADPYLNADVLYYFVKKDIPATFDPKTKEYITEDSFQIVKERAIEYYDRNPKELKWLSKLDEISDNEKNTPRDKLVALSYDKLDQEAIFWLTAGGLGATLKDDSERKWMEAVQDSWVKIIVYMASGIGVYFLATQIIGYIQGAF
jgi:hypothetical protein